MKVLIFGATGGIGKWAVKHALEKGHEVTAFVRNPEKINIQDPCLHVVQGNISNYDHVLSAVTDQDAVIWCVGIPMNRKYNKMESLEGHQVLLKAMNTVGVKRIIDWATPSVSFKKDKKSVATVIPKILAGIAFPMAKAEIIATSNLIQTSDLDWTIVRFLAPKDTPYTGNVKAGFGDVKMSFNISREDIAVFMVNQLETTNYSHSMPIIGS